MRGIERSQTESVFVGRVYAPHDDCFSESLYPRSQNTRPRVPIYRITVLPSPAAGDVRFIIIRIPRTIPGPRDSFARSSFPVLRVAVGTRARDFRARSCNCRICRLVTELPWKLPSYSVFSSIKRQSAFGRKTNFSRPSSPFASLCFFPFVTERNDRGALASDRILARFVVRYRGYISLFS